MQRAAMAAKSNRYGEFILSLVLLFHLVEQPGIGEVLIPQFTRAVGVLLQIAADGAVA